VQGCSWYKGVLYVASGFYPTYGYPVRIIGIEKTGEIVTEIADFQTEIIQQEAEGVCFFTDGKTNRMFMLVDELYELIFE
jgi:hypothetical protein